MMKKLLFSTVLLCSMFLLGGNAFAQTAFDEDNQNRAIGIAYTDELVQRCVSDARSDGYTISTQARGNYIDGEMKGWTVVFYANDRNPATGGYPIVLAYARIDDNWVVTESECRRD
jgi:hypothetical protein